MFDGRDAKSHSTAENQQVSSITRGRDAAICRPPISCLVQGKVRRLCHVAQSLQALLTADKPGRVKGHHRMEERETREQAQATTKEAPSSPPTVTHTPNQSDTANGGSIQAVADSSAGPVGEDEQAKTTKEGVDPPRGENGTDPSGNGAEPSGNGTVGGVRKTGGDFASFAKRLSAKSKGGSQPLSAVLQDGKGKQNGCAEDLDLPLGSEAHCLDSPQANGIDSTSRILSLPDAVNSKAAAQGGMMGWQSFNSDVSTSAASTASLDMLLNDRLVDPEEVLFNLGFGGPQPVAYVPSLARIPQRFLQSAATRAAAAENGSSEAAHGLGLSSPEDGGGGSVVMANSGYSAAAVQAVQQQGHARKRTGGFYMSGVMFLPCHGYVDLARLVRVYNIPLVFFNKEGSKCYRRVRVRDKDSLADLAADGGESADLERRRSSRRSKRTIRRRKTGGKSMHQSRSWIESVAEEEMAEDEKGKQQGRKTVEVKGKSFTRNPRKSAQDSQQEDSQQTIHSDEIMLDVSQEHGVKNVFQEPPETSPSVVIEKPDYELNTVEQTETSEHSGSHQDLQSNKLQEAVDDCSKNKPTVIIPEKLTSTAEDKPRRKKFFDFTYVKMAAKKLGDAMTGKIGKTRMSDRGVTVSEPARQADGGQSGKVTENPDHSNKQIILDRLRNLEETKASCQDPGSPRHVVSHETETVDECEHKLDCNSSPEQPKLKLGYRGRRGHKHQVHSSHPNLVSRLCMAPLLASYSNRRSINEEVNLHSAEIAVKCASESALSKHDQTQSHDASDMEMSSRCHSLEPEEGSVAENVISPVVNSGTFASSSGSVLNDSNNKGRSNPAFKFRIDSSDDEPPTVSKLQSDPSRDDFDEECDSNTTKPLDKVGTSLISDSFSPSIIDTSVEVPLVIHKEIQGSGDNQSVTQTLALPLSSDDSQAGSLGFFFKRDQIVGNSKHHVTSCRTDGSEAVSAQSDKITQSLNFSDPNLDMRFKTLATTVTAAGVEPSPGPFAKDVHGPKESSVCIDDRHNASPVISDFTMSRDVPVIMSTESNAIPNETTSVKKEESQCVSILSFSQVSEGFNATDSESNTAETIETKRNHQAQQSASYIDSRPNQVDKDGKNPDFEDIEKSGCSILNSGDKEDNLTNSFLEVNKSAKNVEDEDVDESDVAPAGSLGTDSQLISEGSDMMSSNILSLLSPDAGTMEFMLGLNLPAKEEDDDASSEVSSEYGHGEERLGNDKADEIDDAEEERQEVPFDEQSSSDEAEEESGDEDDYDTFESGEDEINDSDGDTECEEGDNVMFQLRQSGLTTNDECVQYETAFCAFDEADKDSPIDSCENDSIKKIPPWCETPANHNKQELPDVNDLGSLIKKESEYIQLIDKSNKKYSISDYLSDARPQLKARSLSSDALLSLQESGSLEFAPASSMWKTTPRSCVRHPSLKYLKETKSLQQMHENVSASESKARIKSEENSWKSSFPTPQITLTNFEDMPPVPASRPLRSLSSCSLRTLEILSRSPSAPYPNSTTLKHSSSSHLLPTSAIARDCLEPGLLGSLPRLSASSSSVSSTSSGHRQKISKVIPFYRSPSPTTAMFLKLRKTRPPYASSFLRSFSPKTAFDSSVSQKSTKTLLSLTYGTPLAPRPFSVKTRSEEDNAIIVPRQPIIHSSDVLLNINLESVTRHESEHQNEKTAAEAASEEIQLPEISSNQALAIQNGNSPVSLAIRKRQARKTTACDPRQPGRMTKLNFGVISSPVPEHTSCDFSSPGAPRPAEEESQLSQLPDPIVNSRRQSVLMRRRTSTGCITSRQNVPPTLGSSSSAEWVWLQHSRRTVEDLNYHSVADQDELDMSNVSTSSEEDSDSNLEEKREGRTWEEIFSQSRGSVLFGL
ncbi:hypothetical protein PoB_004491800 [Plakobranchus ocellatus]|uniref:ITPR-interacting domain-containing protein n=1 Tax=Plakobranchus ocellatus TaxID=259542 RepID=A0AAV4BFM9_9GAST|nr:hypothetical protein PoB_004491800 [Plakobranchus ocellatus]